MVDWDLLYFIFILVIFAGTSYLIMRLCKRWTQKTKYELFFNVLIFIVSFFSILFTAFVIFITNVSFER